MGGERCETYDVGTRHTVYIRSDMGGERCDTYEVKAADYITVGCERTSSLGLSIHTTARFRYQLKVRLREIRAFHW